MQQQPEDDATAAAVVPSQQRQPRRWPMGRRSSTGRLRSNLQGEEGSTQIEKVTEKVDMNRQAVENGLPAKTVEPEEVAPTAAGAAGAGAKPQVDKTPAQIQVTAAAA